MFNPNGRTLNAILLNLIQIKEKLMSAPADPLAGITQSVADLTASVTALGAVVTSVVAALQAAAAGNGFSPAEAANLAASIESQVSAINSASAAETAALPTSASPASAQVKKS
jgi:hypothetical protein